MLSSELLDRILAALPGKTVGLVGDLFLDRYLDIDAARNEPSVETGLTAYQVTGVRSYPGALGTVLANLAALGVGRIVPVSVIGDDGEGYELTQALAKLPAVDASHLIRSADRRTPTYTKPMLHEGGSVRELNRLDIKNRTPTAADLQARIIAKLDLLWPSFDALLVLDQVSEIDCGVVTAEVRGWIGERAQASPGLFVLADSREQIGKFRNVCVKPNLAEAERWVPGADAAALANLVNGPVFLTRSEAGILLAKPGGEVQAVPAYPVAGPIDPCGAGDSCSAAIACAMASGTTLEEAAAFGNLIASITVQQIGVTGTASPDMARRRWEEVSNSPQSHRGHRDEN